MRPLAQVRDGERDGVLREVGERHAARDDLEEHDAVRVDVALLARLLQVEHLGRRPRDRAELRGRAAGLAAAARFDFPAAARGHLLQLHQPEVGHLAVEVRVDVLHHPAVVVLAGSG